jgi:5'-methylthioadenosine phosphorylase
MIGIIGGSGLEDPKFLKGAEEKEVETKFGKPSSPVTIGEIAGKRIAIISRHGRKHEIMPTNVNNRANIWALKELGVKKVLATTACGSLREEIVPGDIVFADQFIDWTSKRSSTFFDKEEVCHIPMADPFCEKTRGKLIETAKALGLEHHGKGTIVTIEGPRFSTRAESNMFRTIGGDVINMSTVPEVVLAREAGLCYQAIALATDYDCWKQEERVDIGSVLEVFKKNVENVKKLLLETIPKLEFEECACQKHIDTAVIKAKDD